MINVDEAMVFHHPVNVNASHGWAEVFDTTKLRIVKKFIDGKWIDGEH